MLFDRTGDYHLLWRTLGEWARIHAAGLHGKLSVIRQYAAAAPVTPVSADDHTQQVLWALRDKTCARAFATLSSPPPAEWLPVLDAAGLLKLVPEPMAPWDKGVPVASADYLVTPPPPLHPATYQLCRWLALYRDSRAVIDWVLSSGGTLHPEARRIFEDDLEKIKLPKAFRIFWRIVTGPEATAHASFRWGWPHDREWDALAAGEPEVFKVTLLACVTPRLVLGPTARLGSIANRGAADAAARKEVRLCDLAECAVRLRGDSFSGHEVKKLCEFAAVRQHLPSLADELGSKLKRAFDLQALYEHAEELWDYSYIHQPSIGPHEQNHHYEPWTVLVELLREAFDALAVDNPFAAKAQVARWRSFRFPIFRRFEMYGLAKLELFAAKDGLEFLVTEKGGWWLWSHVTSREATVLTDAIWAGLCPSDRERLVSAIVSGPPREMYRADLSADDWAEHRDRHIWRRLKRIETRLGGLPEGGAKVLSQLSAKWPQWQMSVLDETGLAGYVSTATMGWDSEYTTEQLLAMDGTELLAVLRAKMADSHDGTLHRWQEAVPCDRPRATRFLTHLADNNEWLEPIWSATIGGMKPDAASAASEWEPLSTVLLRMPPALLSQVRRTLAFLVSEYAKHLPSNQEPNWLQVWDRVAKAKSDDNATFPGDPVGSAFNAPLGILTDALLNRLGKRRLERGKTLVCTAAECAERFDTLVADESDEHANARIVLTSRLRALHVVDPQWVTQHLLPRLNWAHPEASGLWQGYLWTPRFDPDLLATLKPLLPDLVRNRERLGEFRRGLCEFIALICYAGYDAFDRGDQARILRQLDACDLAEVARALSRFAAEEGAPKNAWTTNLSPALDLWPKGQQHRSLVASQSLALLATYAGEDFPAAVAKVTPLLTSGCDHPDVVLDRIKEAELASTHPRATLDLLDHVVGPTFPCWDAADLREVLNTILTAWPEAVGHPTYRRLNEVCLRCGT